MKIADATLCNLFWRNHSSTYFGYQLGLYKVSIHVKQICVSAMVASCILVLRWLYNQMYLALTINMSAFDHLAMVSGLH